MHIFEGPAVTKYNLLITAFVAVGSITYGYGNAVIAQALGQPQFYTYFGLSADGGSFTETQTGLANGVFSMGGAFGALSIAYVADALGRLMALRVACSIGILGGALMTGAANLAMFQVSRLVVGFQRLIVRFIMGFSIGMIVCAVPLYQAEAATAARRGFMVGLHGVGIACGYTLTGFVGFGCYFAASSFQWRFPFAVQIIPVLILLAGSFFLPESPRWLLAKGRSEDAWQTVRKLHHVPTDIDDSFAKSEFDLIANQLNLEKQRREQSHVRHWTDFLKRPAYRKRLLIGMFTQFCTSANGNLVVNNYQITIYNNLGITGSLPILLVAFWNALAICGNIFGASFMDKWGRRKFFIAGIIGTASCLSFEAALTKYYVKPDNPNPNHAALGAATFFVFLFVGFHSSCMDAQQYVYVSEIFPMEIRSLGVGISLFVQFAATALFVGVTSRGFASWKYYLVYICLAFLDVTVVYFCFPETKGLALEEIGVLFDETGTSSSIPIRKRHKTKDHPVRKEDAKEVERV